MSAPKGIILTFAIMGSLAVFAQHSPITSQYLFNGLLINPAYAGSREALTANLTYRHQWAGFEGAPRTSIASIHAPLERKKIALGVTIFNDRIGVSQETGIFTNYAYRIPMGQGKLSFGLGAGATVMRANWTDVLTTEAGDVEFMADSRSVFRPNFSTGVYYSMQRRYFAGLSVPFMLSHAYDAESERWDIGHDLKRYEPMLLAGALIRLDPQFKLKPSLLVRYDNGSGAQADINANLIIRDKLWIGASYRTNDAIVGMFEFLPSPQLRIGYAYDISISEIAPYENGTHELMVQYEFGYRVRARDPRYF